jgi:hypothetical protein
VLTPDEAYRTVKTKAPSEEWFATGKSVHPQYAYRFEITGPITRHLSIDRRAEDNGTCLFVNALASDGTRLPVQSFERRGISVREHYPEGHVGKNGNPGISVTAAAMPTLNPANNEVYRLCVGDETGLLEVMAWYSGASERPGPAPSDNELQKALDNAQERKDVDEEVILRAIKTRRGQPAFRRALIEAYEGRCCITGCRTEAVLEAAHIGPHASATDYSLSNGLLLRADIHTLFDLRLITIDESYVISVSSSLAESDYSSLHRQKIHLPRSRESWPSSAALAARIAESRQLRDD